MERREAEEPDFAKVRNYIRDKLTAVEKKKFYKRYINFLKRDAVIRILSPTVLSNPPPLK
jgi:hypothetical protein